MRTQGKPQGRAFRQAGARQWGGTLQDGVTDATRWVIGQGVADEDRICIDGASYGAYAALMGVAKEPSPYRCAAGYAGVYDLPTMRREDRFGSRASRTWMSQWVGDDPAVLAAASPNRMAERIKAPVFLAAGGDDLVAPIEHSRMMERALKAAGVRVETLYFGGEGHGFYKRRAVRVLRRVAFNAYHPVFPGVPEWPMSLRVSLLSAVAWSACLLIAPPVVAAERGLDVRDLVRLDRVSSPLLTPDGSTLVFAQRSVDAELKATTALYARSLSAGDAAPPRRITPDGWNVNSPSLSTDGRTVYFLSGKSGSSQLYAMPIAGGAPLQLTALLQDVSGYSVSPDGRKVALALAVFPECKADLACSRKRADEAAATKASGKLFDGLFVRHWDTWADGRMNRLFVADLGGARRFSTPRLLSGALLGDIPSKPFGDMSDVAWSPDGKRLAISVRPSGHGEPWSTNFDIWLVGADGGKARNLTASNKAWDAGPLFSRDGKTLYYRAMKRPGFEADRYAIMAMDLGSGRTREVAPGWDRSPSSLKLSADGKALYAAAQDTGEYPLFRIDLGSGSVRKLVAGDTVSSYALAGDRIALTRNSLHSGDVAYVADAEGGGLRALTPTAAERLPEVRFGDYEQFTFAGAGGATVHGYVVKPWNYREGKRYPVAFLIHGGPQGSFGNGWSYRWNPQTYAGQGYAVVMIDFHGSTGYGQAFTDAISGDWGGKPLEDLRKGWQAAQQKYAFLDGDRACALGASYGGYMTNWLAGNWFEADGSAPFKCLVTHNGVFDTRSMGLVTEELWFTEWEFGGTVWDNPEAYERFNPARHVHKWRTPTLIVAGQNDFRVPIDQSLSAFTALQRRGIESRLLYFPDENHWVLKPANSVQWHDTVNAWLKRHIGG